MWLLASVCYGARGFPLPIAAAMVVVVSPASKCHGAEDLDRLVAAANVSRVELGIVVSQAIVH